MVGLAREEILVSWCQRTIEPKSRYLGARKPGGQRTREPVSKGFFINFRVGVMKEVRCKMYDFRESRFQKVFKFQRRCDEGCEM